MQKEVSIKVGNDSLQLLGRSTSHLLDYRVELLFLTVFHALDFSAMLFILYYLSAFIFVIEVFFQP